MTSATSKIIKFDGANWPQFFAVMCDELEDVDDDYGEWALRLINNDDEKKDRVPIADSLDVDTAWAALPTAPSGGNAGYCKENFGPADKLLRKYLNKNVTSVPFGVIRPFGERNSTLFTNTLRGVKMLRALRDVTVRRDDQTISTKETALAEVSRTDFKLLSEFAAEVNERWNDVVACGSQMTETLAVSNMLTKLAMEQAYFNVATTLLLLPAQDKNFVTVFARLDPAEKPIQAARKRERLATPTHDSAHALFTKYLADHAKAKAHDGKSRPRRKLSPEDRPIWEVCYATGVCFKFNKGSCERGASCPFRHEKVKKPSANVALTEATFLIATSHDDHNDETAEKLRHHLGARPPLTTENDETAEKLRHHFGARAPLTAENDRPAGSGGYVLPVAPRPGRDNFFLEMVQREEAISIVSVTIKATTPLPASTHLSAYEHTPRMSMAEFRGHQRELHKVLVANFDFNVDRIIHEYAGQSRLPHYDYNCGYNAPARRGPETRTSSMYAAPSSAPPPVACLSATGDSSDATEHEWVLDTGCTHSLLGDSALFRFAYDLTPTPNVTVKMNSFPTPCVAAGKLDWKTKLSSGDTVSVQTHVLIVPDSDYNLLAAHSIDGVDGITIRGGLCALQFEGGRVEASTRGGLFRIPLSPTAPPGAVHVLSARPVYTVTPPVHPAMRRLHSALAHAGASTIHHLIRNGYISVPDPATRTAILAVRDIQCVECSSTTVHKTPPRAGHEPHRDEAGLWSADACFINTPSVAGNVLFSGWLCHRNNKLFISYHKRKSDITPWFVQNKRRMETEAATAMRTLRTDNGTEYTNSVFAEYCASEGVTRQHTSPGSSFQNSNIEVRFRDIRSHAGASLRQSGLASKFWPEAVNNYVFLRERLPSVRLLSTYEQIHKQRPSLSNSHPFGCLAFAHDPHASKSGLRPRARKVVNLGPAETTKDGHRLLNMETGRLIVSRDVRFVDDVFPYAADNTESRSRDLSLPFLGALENNDVRAQAPAVHAVVDPPAAVDPLAPRVDPPAGLGDLYDGLRVVSAESISADAASPVEIDHEPQHPADKAPLRPKSTRVRNNVPPTFDPSAYRVQEDYDRRSAVGALVANTRRTYAMVTAGTMANGVSVAPREPNTVSDVFNMEPGERRERYVAALHSELKSLLDRGVWRAVDRVPRGRVAIPSRVVLKVKLDSDGNEDRFKARLVAKGFKQRAELDFGEIFSPTLRFNTLRALLAAAVHYQLPVHQADIETAFLNADVEEELYMKLPEFDLLRELLPGLPIKGPYVRVQKSIYGLRQSPRNFNHHLADTLRSIGFTQSDADPCLWLKTVEGELTAAVATFVDDLAICARASELADIKDALRKVYTITDGGSINYFLGVRMHQDLENDTISMVQDGAVTRLLAAYGMSNAKPVATPADHTPFFVDPDETPTQEELEYMANKDLRALVGSLLYLLVTRPDISFAVNRLTRVVNTPRKVHWLAAMRAMSFATWLGLSTTASHTVARRRSRALPLLATPTQTGPATATPAALPQASYS